MARSLRFPCQWTVKTRGTQFNFFLRTGVGGALRLTRRLFLTSEVGIYHLSNGGLSEENPGIDGWTFNTGLMFPY